MQKPIQGSPNDINITAALLGGMAVIGTLLFRKIVLTINSRKKAQMAMPGSDMTVCPYKMERPAEPRVLRKFEVNL